MKNGKIFNYIVTLILLPLWLEFVKDLIKQIPLLYWTVTGILTLLMVFFLVLTINELRIKLDAHFNNNCRIIDGLIPRVQKKLQRIIARTSDVSVMDYALTKLREICPAEVYSGILAGIMEKERNPDKRKALFFYNKQIEKQIGGQS